jgi:Icc-related predicted phosphoesterase
MGMWGVVIYSTAKANHRGCMVIAHFLLKFPCTNLPDTMPIEKIVLISDTHGKHKQIQLPEGDLLIHAGDITGRGFPWQVREFMDWFGRQPHRHKVMIAGNHDFLAEEKPEEFLALVPPGVHYLNDSGVEIEGIRIWGSPIQPWFHNWAFNRQRGPNIAAHWAMIPAQTDILVTHGPPFGVLDYTATGERVGCEDLSLRLAELRPRLHVFGHIHESYGYVQRDGIHYVNASVLNLRYEYVQAPVVLDWPLVDL